MTEAFSQRLQFDMKKLEKSKASPLELMTYASEQAGFEIQKRPADKKQIEQAASKVLMQFIQARFEVPA